MDPETTLAPPGACDCHVHVFDPQRFPYDAKRPYTPGDATVPDLRAHLDGLNLDRCVIVQPSVYGHDNRCLLDALSALGGRARGVAVVAPQVAPEELADLWQAGVRALRVNLEARPGERADKLSIIRNKIERVAGSGLAVQLYVDLPTAAEVLETGIDLPIILDHHAGIKAGVDLNGRPFRTLIDHLRSGRVWVKLSAPYRAGSSDPAFEDLRPAASAMIEAAPGRMLWASDWPHTGGGADRARRGPLADEPFRQVDDAADLRRLRRWAGDDTTFTAILADNPRAIFDFPAV